MKPFAELLERLLYSPQRNVKIALILAYFRTVPDPDRGWGLAALTGALSFAQAKPGMIRELMSSRADPVLFGWSYDFVGDLAETAALTWPEPAGERAWPTLDTVVATLAAARKSELPGIVADWLDGLDATGRWALLKLVTGGLRVGARPGSPSWRWPSMAGQEPAEIEEVWHGLDPPYAALFAWLDGRAARPTADAVPVFRPLMLAHPVEGEDLTKVVAELDRYAAEWKWDGIRVQISATPAGVRLYSRSGDDVSNAFPDLVDSVGFQAVLDGELLVKRAGEVASFNDLQQRLNRKTVTARMLVRLPRLRASLRYTVRWRRGPARQGVHGASAAARSVLCPGAPTRMDVSPLVEVGNLEDLERLRGGVRGTPIEGLMLKRKDSPYLAGRPKGYGGSGSATR